MCQYCSQSSVLPLRILLASQFSFSATNAARSAAPAGGPPSTASFISLRVGARYWALRNRGACASRSRTKMPAPTLKLWIFRQVAERSNGLFIRPLRKHIDPVLHQRWRLYIGFSDPYGLEPVG